MRSRLASDWSGTQGAPSQTRSGFRSYRRGCRRSPCSGVGSSGTSTWYGWRDRHCRHNRSAGRQILGATAAAQGRQGMPLRWQTNRETRSRSAGSLFRELTLKYGYPSSYFEATGAKWIPLAYMQFLVPVTRPGWSNSMVAAALCAAPTTHCYKRRRPERTLWYFLKRDTALQGTVLPSFLSAVERCLHEHSPACPVTARIGAFAFIHRFGSNLNERVHFNCCVINGVFEPAVSPGEAPSVSFSCRPCPRPRRGGVCRRAGARAKPYPAHLR